MINKLVPLQIMWIYNSIEYNCTYFLMNEVHKEMTDITFDPN